MMDGIGFLTSIQTDREFFFLLWLYFEAGWEVQGYEVCSMWGEKTTPNNPKPLPQLSRSSYVVRLWCFLVSLSLQSNLQLATATFRLASVLSLPSKTALSARRTNRSCTLTQIDFCFLFFFFFLFLFYSHSFSLAAFSCKSEIELGPETKGQRNRSSQRAPQ